MKTSDKREVRQLYDSSADSYSAMMDGEIDLPVYADTLGGLAQRIAGIPGSVIDTSCGSGHMLALYQERYDPERAVVGIDLSRSMVDIARDRLGDRAQVLVGDMRDLEAVEPDSAAAVLSFFAVHHLDPEEAAAALLEWHRVLGPRGQLVLATWEGAGPIDYGDETDVVALRFTRDEIEAWARGAGFIIDRCDVEPVEGMGMDAVYLEATKA